MKVSDATYGTKLYGYSKTHLDFCLPKKIRPYAATIKLTERCNSKCITCNYWQKKTEDLIDTKTAVDFIRDLARLGVKRIRFSGGEPLLRNDFF